MRISPKKSTKSGDEKKPKVIRLSGIDKGEVFKRLCKRADKHKKMSRDLQKDHAIQELKITITTVLIKIIEKLFP